MNTIIEVKTSQNYTVYLSSEFTIYQYRQVQRVITSSVRVDPISGKPQEFTGDIMQMASDKALELLVVKVTDPQGNTVPNPIEVIHNFNIEDGLKVYDKVDEITQQALPTKKKDSE